MENITKDHSKVIMPRESNFNPNDIPKGNTTLINSIKY